MAKRVMSIWLPQLPLDRRVRMGDPRTQGVFAITQEIKNALRLTHVTQPARAAGLHPGMSIPDARAICPALLTQISDPVREEIMLRALRRWADSLSPSIALDMPDGLFLDITGCSHLFGGETKMAEHTMSRFADMLMNVRIGVADTKGAAWALARNSYDKVAIAERGLTSDALKHLSVEALRLPPKISNDLRRVGLKTIGQLFTVKHSELARRYGLALPQALSKALGQFPDPITPSAIDPVFAARMNLPDPIGLKSDLQAVLERLTNSVCNRLKEAQKGARLFRLTVRCVDTGDHVLEVGFARPCFEAKLVQRQFERPVDELRIEFGADWFRLVALNLEPIRERQRIMGGEAQERADDLTQIITTVGNRLGFDRVRCFTPRESHLPEREFATIEVADKDPITDWPETLRERPIRVFRPERLRTLEPGRPPKKFVWRNGQYTAEAVLGPERLTAEWWSDSRDFIRDYWVVDTQQGKRLWLMTYPHEKNPDWFVTGRFL